MRLIMTRATYTFCPERVGRQGKRGLMVGRFNLVLMGVSAEVDMFTWVQ